MLTQPPWRALQDRASLLDKLKAKAPPALAFQEKFASFQKQAQYFADQQRDVVMGFICLSVGQLASSVRGECVAWSSALAAAMRDLDQGSLGATRARMDRRVDCRQLAPTTPGGHG